MVLSRERGQRTLKERVSLSGIGVHCGTEVSITLCPATPGSGISFLRVDVPDSPDAEILARRDAVGSTELCTVLGDPDGVQVATVEHLLAALAGLRVDNCLIEIDGPEVPVMDGSARDFVEAIDQVGTVVQNAPKSLLRIEEPVRVEHGQGFAEFLPHDTCRLEISIDYDCPVIGRQAYAIDLTAESFRCEIAEARTYGYLRDVERLWAAGFARGSSLENSVVIGEDEVVNPEGLRHPDEFVRHKVLDTIGDLALAGAPIQGLFRSHRGGHALNARAVSALLAQRNAWTLLAASPEREGRPESRTEHAPGMVAAAYAPEVR
jgi:UDP-3-O-[3-hydroxymyristoyl] N-acetylglucosamine deacetylase